MIKRVFIQPQKNSVMLFFSQNERSILFQKAQETSFLFSGHEVNYRKGKAHKNNKKS